MIIYTKASHLIMAALLCMPEAVRGHGYLASPRSRQLVAAEDGDWGGSANLPEKENCPSCANIKNANGFCGKVQTRDYDFPKTGDGSPLPPTAQAEYVEGQYVDMEFVFTANHNGHHITYACPDFDNPTQACFEQYPLEYVEDLSVEAYGTSYNAPKDENFPSRAYVNPAASKTKMRFKLPEGLHGDPANDNLVLLQWHWVTGNSCRSEGYDDYNFPPGWSPDNMGPCPPLSDTGVDVPPEQFWNCAEVKIVSSAPTTPAPTGAPTTASPTISAKPTSVTPAPVTPAPVTPAPTGGNGCCSQNYKDCDATWCGDTKEKCLSCGTSGDKTWLPNGPVTGCIARFGDCTSDVDGCCAPSSCIGNEYYRQCRPDLTGTPTTPTPTPPSPTPPSPTPPTPTPPSPSPPGGNSLFSTTNARSSYDALKELDVLTNVIQAANPPIYALVAEGGAAGNGNVVSEGQAYAVMIAGITLAAMEPSDPNRQDTIDRFYGYFNGWKRMCVNSTPKAFCQSMKLCGGGNIACLPGWKHDKDLTEVTGTGAAPDGDEDAISGMIMAVKAVENDAQKPVWYDEVRQWADASSTSFLLYNTKPSTSGNNRIVKLGTCWGGWESEGNNPSYHSPGSYRFMKDYQASFPASDRDYSMPSFNDGISSLEERWDMVISTSYKFLEASQCDDMGLVPNWALGTELSDGSIASYPGSFSGSGTPQYEFGAEASRTMWRVLFDVALYPQDAFEEAENFLNPVHARLDTGFSNSDWSDQTLMPCDGVTNVFGGWRNNAFMYAPVYSTLVLEAGGLPTADQQEMVDAAGTLVNNIPAGTSYYSRCWSIIGIITLNGDVAKAGANVLGNAPSPPTSPVTDAPTASPSFGPSASPTAETTSAPTVSVKDCLSYTVKADCNVVSGCSWRRSNGGACKDALSTQECSAFDGLKRKCKRKGCVWKNLKKICKGRWD